MQRGWNASGLLEVYWDRVGGRDGLAEATGINTATISGVNSGRLRLGINNARRIADALNVSVLELGAPVEEADEEGMTLLDRLQALEAALRSERERFDSFVESVTERLVALEAAPARQARRGGRRQ